MRENAVEVVMETLGSYNPSLRMNSEGDWGMVSCPLAPVTHGGGRDKHPSFAVSIGPGLSYGKCFSCGFQGGMLALVRQATEYSLIAPQVGDDLAEFIMLEEKRSALDLPEPTAKETPQVPALLVEGLGVRHPYWDDDRGFDLSVQRAWNLGYSDEQERVLVPFYDYTGKLVGIVGRDVTGKAQAKYHIYPSGFDRASYVFGEHRISGQEKAVLLVEGYMDAISASRYLPPEIGVVALGSASPSETQIRKLSLIAQEVILGLDNYNAGMLGTEKCKRMLGSKVRVTQVEYGDHKDADDAGDTIVKLVEERRNPLLVDLLGTLRPLTKDSHTW